ncbi:MAG: cation-translocating P-type ATPase C-terminal domain-containing protein, partial [Nitrospiraceae bacterium]|nr:cation-translocating P-type ATPase C-terminal domain-containing protein [Nitrospiraceae bacterium]
FFVSIVICQISNVMVCRTSRESVFRKGIFANRLILLGIASEVFLVWLIVHNDAARTIFGTSRLTAAETSLSLPFAFFILFVEELRKLLLRRQSPIAKRFLDW